ncbi:amino acid permease/ SLC12A domain-containing protein [Elsinoe ampelina]|uniref:Amino acid permease/ SLC12A domain-containing protein n=1 Tax=Elsinoe ampelina TaxID=302913 RepID=A0A6A6FZ42_9PEZI|nr:amino acid permease/ SLC12A domain-containing protein [Elsinoe ampelina]
MASNQKIVNVNQQPITEKPKATSLDGSDVEKAIDHGVGKSAQLQRRLKSRHLQMIAIGGTIGTGLFIGSGGALATAGPAGTLIAYAFVGTLVYSVMVALGEMATYIPVSGAFTAYASRFVDPSLGFAMGWIYWFSWAITFALELTASGLIIQWWAPSLNVGIFIGVFWILITGLNMLPVSTYGEVEFYFASIKVITVIGFMIFAICIDAGAGQNGYLGFDTWKTPGAFNPSPLVPNSPSLGKFVSLWSVMITAGFSYQGTELVGIAAGETTNPRKTVPAAIKKTFYRIIFFYVLTVFFIGLLIPSDNERLASDDTNASASPFVIAADLAGVKVLPSIINAVLVCVVLSAANSNVYSGSRILVGLAEERSAPAMLKRTTASGVPYVAVLFTAAFGLLGFMNESASGGEVFNWLLSITGVAGFVSWTCIGVSHIAFMKACKAQGVARESLPYTTWGQPWFTWYGVVFNILIILTQGFEVFVEWSTSDFFVYYISLILFVVLYVGHKTLFRKPFVKAEEADLDSGRREVEEMVWEEKVPTTVWGKFWAWLG